MARVGVCLLVAISVVVVGAGCGSDDSATGTTSSDTIKTSTLTKAQFVKRADKICDQQSVKISIALGAYLNKNVPRSGQNEEAIVADAVREILTPNVRSQIKEIRALGGPAGDEEQVEAILTAMQESVDSLDGRQRFSLEEDLGPAFQQEGKLARDYGLASCAYG